MLRSPSLDRPPSRPRPRAWLALAAAIGILAVGILPMGAALLRPSSARAAAGIDLARVVDLRHVHPGSQARFRLGGDELRISVPSDPSEGATFGSFHLSFADDRAAPLRATRDGTLETLHVADVDGDGSEDGLLTVRNGGSGSHAQLYLVASSANGTLEITELPSGGTLGDASYRGHDVVTVEGGRITRRYPAYHDEGLRLDRRYGADDLARGVSPIRSGPDSNHDPSGADRVVVFDLGTWRWVTDG